MALQVLQILKVDTRRGIGKASGKPYEMVIAKCNVLDEHGQFIDHGELVLPDAAKNYGAGFYAAELQLSSYRGHIEARVTGLRPVNAKASNNGAAAKAA